MKTTSSFSSFLIIFIFIFTTITLNSPTSTADCNNFVCDTNWNHVKSGQPYRYGTPLPNQGGDIILNSTLQHKPCPRNAIIVNNGLAGDNFIIIPTVHADGGLVPLETPFSISSGEQNDGGSCNESPGYLKITRKDKKVKFWRVTDDGEFNTSSSCFQFVKFPLPTDSAYTPTYMLQNCPWKCGELSPGKKKKCFQIGNRTADGYQYLASNGYPFEFAIKGNDDDDDDDSGYLSAI